MSDAINQFFEEKNIVHPYMQGCIREFVDRHTELYGNIISREMVLERLRENLDGIVFDASKKEANQGHLCFYEGFQKNQLVVAMNAEDLENPFVQQEFQKSLYEELTKAAYTSKKHDVHHGERLFFGTYEEMSDGGAFLVSGHDFYREAFSDYISSHLLGLSAEECSNRVLEMQKLGTIVGSHSMVEQAWFSDGNRFRSLFDVFSHEQAFELFSDGIWKMHDGEDYRETFRDVYDSLDVNEANFCLKANAPFWTEKRYRAFMKEPMKEEDFAIRLHKTFEHEAELHPEFREAIFRGENEELVRLVATEYLYDLEFQSEKEVGVENSKRDGYPEEELVREYGEKVVSATEREEESEEDFTEPYDEAFEVEEEIPEEDKDAEKKEAKAKRAAFSKKRNEQYAAGNAESDLRQREEMNRQEALRLLDEERRRVRESYEKGFYVPEYVTPTYMVPNYEPVVYPLPDFSNFQYEDYQARLREYEVPNYLQVKYENPSYESKKYDSPDYSSPAYSQRGYENVTYESVKHEPVKYEQGSPTYGQSGDDSYYRQSRVSSDYNPYSAELLREKREEERRRISEAEQAQRRREEQERLDQAYYKKMHDAENYQKKNQDGHFSFDERERVGKTEYNSGTYESGYGNNYQNSYQAPYDTYRASTPDYGPFRGGGGASGAAAFGAGAYAGSRFTDSQRSNTGSGAQSGSGSYNPFEERFKRKAGNGPGGPGGPGGGSGGSGEPKKPNSSGIGGANEDFFGNTFSAKERAKEQFQKFSEKSLGAVNNVRYLSARTGYTSFLMQTGRATTRYMSSEVRGSDDLSEISGKLYDYNHMQQNIRGVTAIAASPLSRSLRLQGALDDFIKADVGRELKELRSAFGFTQDYRKAKTDVISGPQKEFLDAIKNKKARTDFLEKNHIFDYSSKIIKNEVRELSKLEKRGRLTEVQEKRLDVLRNGTSVRDVDKKIKNLLKKEKKGLLTAADKLELAKFQKSKAVLNAKGMSRFREGFTSVYYLFSDVTSKSDDIGMSGLLKIGGFGVNPYTQRTVRASVKFVKLSARTAGRVTKAAGKYYLNNTASGRAVKETAKLAKRGVQIKADAINKKALGTLNRFMESGSKSSRFAKKTIDTAKKARTFSHKGLNVTKKVMYRIRHPFKGRVSTFAKRTMNVILKPFRLLNQGLAVIRGFITKILLAVGGVFFAFVLLLLAIELIGAGASAIMGPAEDDRIDLSEFVSVLNDEADEFSKTVKSNAKDANQYYGKVIYNFATKDNMKEIMSMSAVRYEQDLLEYHTEEELMAGTVGCIGAKKLKCPGHLSDEVENYLRVMYQNSHQVSYSYGEEYSCGEKNDACPFPQDEKIEYVVQEYEPPREEPIYDEEGNQIGTETIPEVPEIIDYLCPGKHRNVTVSTTAFGFDQIFMVDGNGGVYGEGGAQPLAQGESILIPDGLGKVHTYMGWHTVTSITSKQYQLREESGEYYDTEGFARIKDRYVIACTSTFGEVGDYVNFTQKDGTVLKCIIGDIKNQNDEGCNQWGHKEGKVIVEFVVNGDTWYKGGKGSHANPGTNNCHPEWKQALVKCENLGNYWGSDGSGTNSSQTGENNSVASDLQQLVASNAKNNVSTKPCTANYCAAWVSGVYQASGLSYPGGNAIDFWTKWKSSGSNSMNNIPVGAVVVGSGSGPMGAIYGHVGIYIGNNMVADNIGRHRIISLDDWAASQDETCNGYRGFIGWVWPKGEVLGDGVDGSSGTLGYSGFSIWDADNQEWAKHIYEGDWDILYKGLDKMKTNIDYSDVAGDYTSTYDLGGAKALTEKLKDTPYIINGSSPETGFDASGFLNYVYSESGMYDVFQWGSRPTATTYKEMCVPISQSEAYPGDIVYWADYNGNAHVGIYYSTDIVYHADPASGKVTYSKLSGSYQIYRLPNPNY